VQRSPRTGLPLIKKTPPRRSTRCAGDPPEALLAGIAQFNAGDFWHCHETLEQVWRVEPDPIRSLYQGILLVGVGYYHLQRGSARGAIAKLAQGLHCLEPFRPVCMRVDVEMLVAAAATTLRQLREGTTLADLQGQAPPRITLLRL